MLAAELSRRQGGILQTIARPLRFLLPSSFQYYLNVTSSVLCPNTVQLCTSITEVQLVNLNVSHCQGSQMKHPIVSDDSGLHRPIPDPTALVESLSELEANAL
mmetsp:Transcript_18517/g.34473  ORF Transcript_18517/g.34473 Transcript_18517/m.34473 type:complete len:103 (-) Transcript_18517:1165-1473(-)